MKRSYLAVAMLGLVGCGPSYGGQDVKTPDELVAEQERIQAENDKSAKERGVDDTASDQATDSEKQKEFDKRQAGLELARATRSAESCPGVVAGEEAKSKPRGEATVTVTFQEDGTVKSVSVPSPFDGTPVGECVLRAYKAVIVPPYTGGEHIEDVKVTLKDQPKAEAEASTTTKKKKK